MIRAESSEEKDVNVSLEDPSILKDKDGNIWYNFYYDINYSINIIDFSHIIINKMSKNLKII